MEYKNNNYWKQVKNALKIADELEKNAGRNF